MRGLLLMKQCERDRKVVMEAYKCGHITLLAGAKQLGLSYRQCKRIWQRYQRDGDLGLIHGNRGKSSSRAKPALKSLVLALYQRHYLGFGPTFAAEKLLERDNVTVHPETLRLWLKSVGLWKRKRKRKAYRQRRAPRAQFGELLQLDGSIHDWFGAGHHTCLMNMVDDATSTTLSWIANGETTHAALMLLKLWIERYGIPKAIYVDLKGTYISQKALKGEADALTVFGKACKRLGIQIIKAYSPQAKGRVERNHAVYQDRLCKEIQLNGFTTPKQVNAFLHEGGFIEKLNSKFAKKPLSDKDAHRKSLKPLYDILCWQDQRQVQNDWTISFKANRFQIEKTYPLIVRPKYKVTVRRHLDGKISCWYHEQKLKIKPIIKTKIAKQPASKNGYDSVQRSRIARKNKSKSPWSTFNPEWIKSKTKGDISKLVT